MNPESLRLRCTSWVNENRLKKRRQLRIQEMGAPAQESSPCKSQGNGCTGSERAARPAWAGEWRAPREGLWAERGSMH